MSFFFSSKELIVYAEIHLFIPKVVMLTLNNGETKSRRCNFLVGIDRETRQ